MEDNDNMTFVNYTGHSDVEGRHGTGNIAGRVNYYAFVHLINITVYGQAYAKNGKEPRCEGIVIGHIYAAKEVKMINISVPQARVLSREFNVGVQGLLMGKHVSMKATLKNWVIGYAERIFIRGYPESNAGGIGTLFAYADGGKYYVSNIVMHTRYSNYRSPTSNVKKVVGGICGYVRRGSMRVTNVTMDFLSTALQNVGLIVGHVRVDGSLTISLVRS